MAPGVARPLPAAGAVGIVDVPTSWPGACPRGASRPRSRTARSVVSWERSARDLQRSSRSSSGPSSATGVDIADTYFHAHFVVTTVFMFWLYLRHRHYYFIRNAVFVADLIALAGFTLFPTAPPRMLTDPASPTRSTATRRSELLPPSPNSQTRSRRCRASPATRHHRRRLASSSAVGRAMLWLCWPAWSGSRSSRRATTSGSTSPQAASWPVSPQRSCTARWRYLRATPA